MPETHRWHYILKGTTPPAPHRPPQPQRFLFSPIFPLLISIATVPSHARAFLLASCHILLLSSCLEVSLSQAGRVELLWVLLPVRDVHLEWGVDRPDSPSPQGLCHVIQASPQALSSTLSFPLYKWRHGTFFFLLFLRGWGLGGCIC